MGTPLHTVASVMAVATRSFMLRMASMRALVERRRLFDSERRFHEPVLDKSNPFWTKEASYVATFSLPEDKTC